jgi:hypothetical protein
MNNITSLTSNQTRVELPFPHLFIQNFLPETVLHSLRATFTKAEFFLVEGGSPSSYIDIKSPDPLFEWSNEFLKDVLVPKLDEVFTNSILEKKYELMSNYKIVERLNKPKFGYLHLSKQNIGAKIPSHRDDDRSSYQFVIYLGDFNGEKAETTELIYVDEIDQLEKTQDYSKLQLLNYGKSANGFLCFVNQRNSYHCLTGPTTHSRMTILGSVVHYDCN